MLIHLFPWQTKIWQELLERHHKKCLPQAWLFEGKKGIGKTTLAKAYARQVLCQSENLCQENILCRSCQLITANTHPDFFHLVPEGLSQTIKIDPIRGLNEAVFKTAHLKGYKVVVIEAADRMNPAASNALLKTLEEPPAQVLFILITASLHRVSATIRSRCEKTSFIQPNEDEAKSWLSSQLMDEYDAATVNFALRLSQGSPLEAKSYLETEGLQWRDSIINDVASLFLESSNPLDFSEKYKLLSLHNLLFWLKTIIVDLIRCKTTFPDRIINIDKKDLFSQMAAGIHTENLFSCLSKLYALDHKIANGFNLNHALVVDEVFGFLMSS